MSPNKVRYRSGDSTFHTKVLAYEHHYKYDTKEVTFEFANGSFYDHDFTKEPNESFDELCKQRALQIRDSTPYLALTYSGGSDSNHLLDCFVRNKIRIDEIIMLKDGIMKAPNHIPHIQNWEIDNHAIPYLKTLDLPGTKITERWSYADEEELLTFLDHDSQFLHNRMSGYAVHIMGWIKFAMEHQDLVFTCGSTEPRIGYDASVDKYYSMLYDTDNLGYRANFTSFMPFYTDPMFAKLHIKQCHLMKNYFREFGHEGMIIGSESTTQKYKELVIKLTRYNSFDTSDSPFFVKRAQTVEEKFPIKMMGDAKTRNWINYLNKARPDFLQAMVSSMQQTIDNFPVYALPTGVPVYKKLYLE